MSSKPQPIETDLEPSDVPAREVPSGAVLSVRNLGVEFRTDDGLLKAVDDVSFDVFENEILGIVGESGSGKSVSVMSVLGLLPRYARTSGDVLMRGTNLQALSEKEMQKLRGEKIAMVFQDALTALNPVYTVGNQITEAITTHHEQSKREVRERVIELLDLVGIPSPKQRIDQFPHEYSGGMRQRAMIAMAIANDPDVLIADEPTTALDVTIQAQVLDVLQRVQERTNSAILLITHDLGVVAGIADRVMVMYAGRQVELGDVDDVFYHPRHPYTLGLLASLPRLDRGEKGEKLYRIPGQPPSLIFIPSGCPFHPRCAYARVSGPCDSERPAFRVIDAVPPHHSACHFAEELVGAEPEEFRKEVTS